MNRRTFIRSSGVALIAAGLAGCTGDDEPANGGNDEPLVMAGTEDEPFAFVPDSIEIEPGTTVTWEWGTDTHNIAVRDQPADADWEGEPEIQSSGHVYSHTFEVPGTYEYVCEPHEAQGMEGSITVS